MPISPATMTGCAWSSRRSRRSAACIRPCTSSVPASTSNERRACDDRVVAQTGAADRYANCLANAADLLARSPTAVARADARASCLAVARRPGDTGDAPARSADQPRRASEMGEHRGEHPGVCHGGADLTRRAAAGCRARGNRPAPRRSTWCRPLVERSGQSSALLPSWRSADRGASPQPAPTPPVSARPAASPQRGATPPEPSGVPSIGSFPGRCRAASRTSRRRRLNRAVRRLRAARTAVTFRHGYLLPAPPGREPDPASDSAWKAAGYTGAAVGIGVARAGLATGTGSRKAGTAVAGFFSRAGKAVAGGF